MPRGILNKATLNYLKKSILALIYPITYKCLSCHDELDDIGLCSECESKIKPCSNIRIIENTKIYSISYYGYAIKKLILDFKYKSNFDAGEYLGRMLLKKIDEINKDFDYITYVPSSRKKLRERGFNQCEVLAKFLSENRDVSYVESLKKINSVKEQKFLGAVERKANIKNAFSLIDNERFIRKKVLLIDDVITTGSTIEACIKELNKVKDIELTVVVIAQSLN